jgi:eukaryotic-like serine/threonine-protein kinase
MVEYVGQQLGNYQLIRQLGEGGFAEVYLGEHIYLGTLAAIKVMRMSLPGNETENFRTEARTIANLVHPNIVRVLEFGVQDGNPFLVMDYAPNGTLRQRHPRDVAVPLSTIIPYVKQVAEALQRAHDENLIHRDVKPENMLLGRQNEVLLSDFGIALMAAQNTRDQALETAAGTIGYIAPEQIRGKPRPASDQYSLGIVVYEWLSGNRPFQGSVSEIVSQHLAVPPEPLREKNTSISSAVESVVMKALAKDPKERFATIRDFATALEQACQADMSDATILVRPLEQGGQQEPVAAASNQQTLLAANVNTLTPPATPTTRTALRSPGTNPTLYTYREHTGRVNSIAWFWDGKYFASGSDDQTVLVWNITSGNRVGTYRGHSGKVNAVQYVPGGLRIASGGDDKTVQIWEANTGNQLLTYRGHTNSVKTLAWSPDTLRIASSASDEDVQVWDPATGSFVFIYRGHIYSVNKLAWAPDGQRIASGGGGKAVQIWDAADGHFIFAYRGHSAPVNAIAWSPDSKIIASGGEDKTVQVWDVVTGYNIFTSRDHSSVVTAVDWSPDGSLIASANGDGYVQLWDTSSGRRVNSHRHSSPVRTVAWSPDSTCLAFGGDDGTIQIWVVS